MVLSAEKAATALIADVRAAIDEHNAAGKILKEQAAEHRNALERRAKDTEADGTGEGTSSDKGKGKARAEDDLLDDTPEPEDSDLPRNVVGEEHALQRRGLQQRLRECQITLHKVK